mgnify:CR=1 FL=1|jgi:hypothetical protein
MIDIFKKNSYIIWGTGSSAEEFMNSYPEIKIDYFIETEPSKTMFKKLKVLKASEINLLKSNIIIANEYYDEIKLLLLKQGINSKNILNADDQILRDSDVIVVSYQKCGRTWLRAMIGCFLQRRFKLHEGEILKITQSAPYYKQIQPTMPKFMFKHDDNAHRKQANELSSSKDIYNDKKVIFLSRDPRDVIVSNFYHMTYRIDSNKLQFEDFVKKFFSGIIKYYNIWANYGFNENRLLVRYEDLHTSASEKLFDILNFVDKNIKPESKEINFAIKYASFENMKKYESENRFNSSILENRGGYKSSKIRKGKVGGFKDIMTKDLQLYCEKEIKNLNSIFSYS